MSSIAHWRVITSEVAFDSPWMRVRRDRCELPNREIIPDYHYIEDDDFVRVFVETEVGQALLVREYRHPIRAVALELVAGRVNPGEDSLAAAQRELLEETGFATDRWEQLASLAVSPGKLTNRAHVWLARGARKMTEPSPERTENIEVVAVEMDQIWPLIDNDQIADATSVSGCCLALRHVAAR